MSLIRLLWRLLLLAVIAAPFPTNAKPIYNICSGDTNYTAGSAFSTNLRSLLSSLPANASATGFFNSSVGNIPDRAHGLVLCRGDVSAGGCRTCLDTAVEDIMQLCPFRKSAVIWYDNCMLRYSNLMFFSQPNDGVMVDMWNAENMVVDFLNDNNVTEMNQFNLQLSKLTAGLVSYATQNASAHMFATGDAVYSDRDKHPIIYGLVQCTRDQSADACDACLRGIIRRIPNSSLGGKKGGRVLTSTCNFRYERYPFYNSTAMVSLPLPAAAPRMPAPAGISPPTTSPVSQEEKKSRTGTVLAITVPSVSVFFLAAFIYIRFCRRKSEGKPPRKKDEQEVAVVESLLFDLSTLRIATGHFSDQHKLGEGGFGTVYKGVLPSGQKIAVKRLRAGSAQGVEELKNEVVLLAKLKHRNLVRLMGNCVEAGEKLLIYEYVSNSSLDKFLFDPTRAQQLDWEKRCKIVEGIARGLQYLHEDSQLKIIHRDLKASNVLLDADMNPKISDFGLARLFGVDQAQASTIRVVGTYGYMAPEYAIRGRFSTKSDVFSFGVLVLELLTGRRNSTFSDSEGSPDLLSYVWKHWKKETVMEMVDPSLGGQYQSGEVMRCVQIGLLCVQEDAADRPTMTTVDLMLSSHSMTLHIPSQPAFYVEFSQECVDVVGGSIDSSSTTSSKSQVPRTPYSVNDVSITELGPR